jgi:hypothetical protein
MKLRICRAENLTAKEVAGLLSSENPVIGLGKETGDTLFVSWKRFSDWAHKASLLEGEAIAGIDIDQHGITIHVGKDGNVGTPT